MEGSPPQQGGCYAYTKGASTIAFFHDVDLLTIEHLLPTDRTDSAPLLFRQTIRASSRKEDAGIAAAPVLSSGGAIFLEPLLQPLPAILGLFFAIARSVVRVET